MSSSGNQPWSGPPTPAVALPVFTTWPNTEVLAESSTEYESYTSPPTEANARLNVYQPLTVNSVGRCCPRRLRSSH